jgi:hypothetical protein
VYHRGWWNYYVAGYLHGLISGELFRGRSMHEVVQKSTDGAIARYYTPREWRRMASESVRVERVFTLGPKSDVVLLPAGAIKRFVQRLIPNALSRFLTTNLRMGTFMVSRLKKDRAAREVIR